jgi:hypothetical protein
MLETNMFMTPGAVRQTLMLRCAVFAKKKDERERGTGRFNQIMGRVYGYGDLNDAEIYPAIESLPTVDTSLFLH